MKFFKENHRHVKENNGRRQIVRRAPCQHGTQIEFIIRFKVHRPGESSTRARHVGACPGNRVCNRIFYQSTSYRLYQLRGRGILYADERVYNIVYTHRQRPAATHSIIIIS